MIQTDGLAAVRALDIAHVFDHAQHADLQLAAHVDRFGDDHGHHRLRRGDHDDAIHRDGLQHGQRHITGSRRHVDEQHIQFAPDDVGIKLLDRVGDDRSSPDHRLVFIFHQEVERHALDALFADDRFDRIVAAIGLLVFQSQQARNAGTGNIRIHDADLIAASGQVFGKQDGHAGFPDTAFPAHHADDVADLIVGIVDDPAGSSALPAISLAWTTFTTHKMISSLSYSVTAGKDDQSCRHIRMRLP